MASRRKNKEVGPSHFNLRKFDPSTIRPNSTILFAGGRRTGKSFAMRDIIFCLKDRFYDMHVFTGTNEADHPWETHTPERYVHHCKKEVFPTETLQEALRIQKQRTEICKQASLSVTPSSAFVFEDLEYLSKPIWTVPGIRKIWFNGRHSATYAFCAFQYIMEIKMALRGMFDYAFFTMDNSHASRERIFKQFGGVFPNAAVFEGIFFACTTNHKAMVLDLRSLSYNIEDCVFWYKAQERGPFRVGVSDVWDRKVCERNKSKSKMGGKEKKKDSGSALVTVSLDGYENKEEEETEKPKRSKKKKTT